MKNYWLRIFGSAFGIFVVGMLLITGFRSLRTKVTTALNSSDPIPIPLIGLVPFRLDSAKLGSLSRVEFLRADPQHISGVRVLVKLADSVAPERVSVCQVALDDVDNINEKTTFRCQAQGEVPPGLEPFGQVVIAGSGDSFPLLLPSKAVRELRETSIRLDHKGLHVNGPHNEVADAMAERTDSIRDAIGDRIDARSDSVDALKDQASSLEDSATSLGVAARRRVQRRADSVRVVMRAMVDRMKADEARKKALDRFAGLTPGQLDSLTRMGSRLHDSIMQAVASDLQKAHVEVERARSEVQVEATPPAPPAPSAKPR
jgi:hypothetical protein